MRISFARRVVVASRSSRSPIGAPRERTGVILAQLLEELSGRRLRINTEPKLLVQCHDNISHIFEFMLEESIYLTEIGPTGARISSRLFRYARIALILFRRHCARRPSVDAPIAVEPRAQVLRESPEQTRRQQSTEPARFVLGRSKERHSWLVDRLAIRQALPARHQSRAQVR